MSAQPRADAAEDVRMSEVESSEIARTGHDAVQMHWHVRIPMRDGAHLSATLYLPRDLRSPAPAVFTLLPYVRQIYHDRGLHFAAHGYPVLTVDVRGRGDSDGIFEPFANEAQDGYDVVEWLAQQPFCNGKVAMWGGSYMGFSQWATAREVPPHLATIVPVASACIGVDVPMRNNVVPPYMVQWLTFVGGRALQDKIFGDQALWRSMFKRWAETGGAFKDLDAFVGNASPIFQKWLAHPHQDAYWDSFNPSAQQYASIGIPVLTITGSYDADQPGALMHYREHLKNCASSSARHFLVIGPWDHAGTRIPKSEFGGIKVGPASLVDLPQLHLQWYAWTMQGGPRPPFLQNNVAYYVMGAEKWRYANSLEDVTARSELLYLRSTLADDDELRSGSLAATPLPSGEPDQYVYDPLDVSLAAIETTVDSHNLVDQRLVYASVGRQLVYHSAPFDQDTEISGFFRLSVWLSIDRPDTDFRAAVYEVRSDGTAVRLSVDWIRARYRESLREPKLVHTHEPLRYEFERFTFVSRRIAKGSRLRLVIGPMNSIYTQRNYNAGGVIAEETARDARPVLVRLFHGEAFPSVMHVPIGRPDI